MHSALRGIVRCQPGGRSFQHRTNVAGLLRPSLRYVHTIRYTSDHELVKFDDTTGIGTVGLTHHAQSSLGDVVYVEVPKVGTVFEKGDSIGVVESVKACSDVYAPISGTIEEINSELAQQPGLINKSPEDDGWLCKIKLSDSAEMDKLMTLEEYKAFIAE